MLRNVIYFVFGLVVIGSYFSTVRSGTVFSSAKQQPAPPATRVLAGGTRVRPDFWSPGYLGGK